MAKAPKTAKEKPVYPDNWRICLYSKNNPEGKIFTADQAEQLDEKEWSDAPLNLNADAEKE